MERRSWRAHLPESAQRGADAAARPAEDAARVRANLRRVVQAHVESFDCAVQAGGWLAKAVGLLKPVKVRRDEETARPELTISLESVNFLLPTHGSSATPLLPAQCRELGVTYGGLMRGTVRVEVAGGPRYAIERSLGVMPIMVCSRACHLHGKGREELVAMREEANEVGGYFVVRGLERMIRLLIVPRRNYVMALVRPSFTRRGPLFTHFGCTIRCVRPDQTSQSLVLHYLEDGTCRLRIILRGQEFFLPAVLVLRALAETTDREIFHQIVQDDAGNTFVTDRVELMLRQSKQWGVVTRREALEFLGRSFEVVMPEAGSHEQVARTILRDLLFVHICDADGHGGDSEAHCRRKYDLLVLMVQKLYRLVSGAIRPDNPDTLSMQEVLLPGQLFSMVAKDRLQAMLLSVQAAITRDLRMAPARVDLGSEAYVRRVVQAAADPCEKIEYSLSTGNVANHMNLDLMQGSGFTIVAEKLNFLRFLSHFQSIHRGAYFAEMKTTTVRKLLPDVWGFLCPVHTPDGAPCGLLNHIASECHVHCAAPGEDARAALLAVLAGLGVRSLADGAVPHHAQVKVVLDGALLGVLPPQLVRGVEARLRLLKVKPSEGRVPRELEIVRCEDEPILWLFTSPGRLLRRVRLLSAQRGGEEGREEHEQEGQEQGPATECGTELIGTLEQVRLDIACAASDFRAGETTHMELAPHAMLSLVASLTPFSDFNQSPRNMYQCQMGKQTMATPMHALAHRADTKIYRLQTPQTPIVRNELYTQYGVDEYPMGTNAVVAVIAYTGYDMDDGMIVNKASMERGFAHASMYKTFRVDLGEKRVRGEPIRHRFGAAVSALRPNLPFNVDADGLPMVGAVLQPDEPLYAYANDIAKRVQYGTHKDGEPAAVDQVTLLGDPEHPEEMQTVAVKLRFFRNPVIGDKFSSRHGQKGVLSRLWPQEDMPFTESGMTPDIIINPHAFPSRMTIGMLVESMAGKAGALNGVFHDGTPFRFNEQQRAVDFFGRQLAACGYSYLGNETLYSGTTGEAFEVGIYTGVVYYQRLRHMVSDKSQVRALGPINNLTRQPIKGRKVHGGIRFGEMERDSLLAHGTAFLLHDRLMRCSDFHAADVCLQCNQLLSVSLGSGEHDDGQGEAAPAAAAAAAAAAVAESSAPVQRRERGRRMPFCRLCKTGRHCSTVALPYVFVYLVNELAAMNIQVSLGVK